VGLEAGGVHAAQRVAQVVGQAEDRLVLAGRVELGEP
jgi:hypothetical protein